MLWTSDEYYLDIFLGNSKQEWQQGAFEIHLQNCDNNKQIIISRRSKLKNKVCYIYFWFNNLEVILYDV